MNSVLEFFQVVEPICSFLSMIMAALALFAAYQLFYKELRHSDEKMLHHVSWEINEGFFLPFCKTIDSIHKELYYKNWSVEDEDVEEEVTAICNAKTGTKGFMRRFREDVQKEVLERFNAKSRDEFLRGKDAYKVLESIKALTKLRIQFRFTREHEFELSDVLNEYEYDALMSFVKQVEYVDTAARGFINDLEVFLNREKTNRGAGATTPTGNETLKSLKEFIDSNPSYNVSEFFKLNDWAVETFNDLKEDYDKFPKSLKDQRIESWEFSSADSNDLETSEAEGRGHAQ